MTAGGAAICVAIFPMWYKDLYPEQGFLYEALFRFFSWIHYGSAIVLFICMALVAWFCSKTTLKDERFSAALDKQAPTSATHLDLLFHRMVAGFGVSILYFAKNLPTQRDTFVRTYKLDRPCDGAFSIHRMGVDEFDGTEGLSLCWSLKPSASGLSRRFGF